MIHQHAFRYQQRQHAKEVPQVRGALGSHVPIVEIGNLARAGREDDQRQEGRYRG